MTAVDYRYDELNRESSCADIQDNRDFYENQPILVEQPSGGRITTTYNANLRRARKES